MRMPWLLVGVLVGVSFARIWPSGHERVSPAFELLFWICLGVVAGWCLDAFARTWRDEP